MMVGHGWKVWGGNNLPGPWLQRREAKKSFLQTRKNRDFGALFALRR